MTANERKSLADSLRHLADVVEKHDRDDPEFYREVGFRLYSISAGLYQQGDHRTVGAHGRPVLDMTGTRRAPHGISSGRIAAITALPRRRRLR